MYEKQTFEVIMQRMLAKVPSNVDKREGSIIYNALAPAAVELQNAYIEADVILNESFADTASREYLIKRCAERGVKPDPATKSILEGTFNIDVPINSLFSFNNLIYKAIERISPGIFKMECQTPGTIGNETLGILIPIDYIDGLTTAELTDILIPGEDAEDTEVLRQRYLNSFSNQAYGGNIEDYKQKCAELIGVGGVKVYPVWNGGGTVKIVFIDSEFKKPSAELINNIQTLVDPVQNQGEGLGIAPIGHIVTVEAVTEELINITTTITYQLGWTWESIKSYVENAIDEYFTELNATWKNENALVVRISQIDSRLLAISGVLDITGTILNGQPSNLVLNQTSIAVRGDLIG